MREITKAKMLELYEKGLVNNPVNVGDKVIARSVEGDVERDGRYEVVWCSV